MRAACGIYQHYKSVHSYSSSSSYYYYLRRNLDPECLSSDIELWSALEIAQLKQVVSGLEKGLGNYFSSFIVHHFHTSNSVYMIVFI